MDARLGGCDVLQHKAPGNYSSPGAVLLMGCVVGWTKVSGVCGKGCTKSLDPDGQPQCPARSRDEQGAAACGLRRVLVERGHPAETD